MADRKAELDKKRKRLDDLRKARELKKKESSDNESPHQLAREIIDKLISDLIGGRTLSSSQVTAAVETKSPDVKSKPEVLVQKQLQSTPLATQCPPTCIFEAAKSGDTAGVTAVLAKGTTVNTRDKDGKTPLMVAARYGHTATVQSLVGAGADMNIQDKNGWTALYHAAMGGHTAVVEVLAAAGANLNIGSTDDRTPLMVAACYGHTASVQSLVAAGADMNIKHKDGRTALIVAIQEGEYKAAVVLIKAGAGLSQQEELTGWTALFFAARKDNVSLVRLLLEAGADPAVMDKEGETAFSIAEKHNHQSVTEELEKHTVGQPPEQPVELDQEYTAGQPVEIPFKDLDFKGTVGKGSFGVVHKAYWTTCDGGRKLVAVKQMDKLVKNEVDILGSLCHPNIIKLYGTSENKPYTYLVTDFAEKGSLYNFISNRQSSPDLKRALPWAKQVAEGMLYLHGCGIIHRDLKSSNIVLTSQWVAKICDLGTAREWDHTTVMTSAGTHYSDDFSRHSGVDGSRDAEGRACLPEV